MPKKTKSQKITFKSIVRSIIFIVIIYFSIIWLSNQKQLNSNISDPTIVLGEHTSNTLLLDLYQKLPADSRYQLEHLNQTKLGLWVQDFPSRQIKEIQKAVVKNVSDGIIKNIDKN
jgi:hypothetical protein